MTRIAGLLLAILLLGMLTTPLLGQASFTGGGDLAWERLSKPAGMIFAGTVLRVEQIASSVNGPATVRISLRVDDAVRGCDAGQTILLQEWAELWVHGNRYREGQRVLLFLYPPSDAGLSSPVAGEVGILELGPKGELRLTAQQTRFLLSQTVVASSQAGARSSHGESTDSTRVRLRIYLPNKIAAFEDAQ